MILVRHWYEKDKLLPVDPRKIPKLDDGLLATFPSEYRFLGYCQEKTMGINFVKDLPGHIKDKYHDESGKAEESHDTLYGKRRIGSMGRRFLKANALFMATTFHDYRNHERL